ncbi:MAG: nitroreductase family protein, partial [Bacteroidaceae bacterium]|nr:nitroreductase family protein [Bacteroidaceae bacterium]
DIEEILKCGVYSPNALNAQGWEIRVLTNAETIENARNIFKNVMPERAEEPAISHAFPNAPVYIFIANDTESPYSEKDCGILAATITYAAWAKGLGTLIMGSTANYYNTIPELKSNLEELNFSAGYKLQLVIALGYPAETPEIKPRDFSKIQWL